MKAVERPSGPTTRHAAAEEPDGETPDQIRERIEQTRGEMSETIDAIQDRLDPDRLKEQVKESVRAATIGRAEHMVSDVQENAREKGSDMLETIKDNPIPAALIGIGLGWMLMKGSDQKNRRNRDFERYEPSGADDAPYREYRRRQGYASSSQSGERSERYDDAPSGLGATASQAGSTVGQVGATARRSVGAAGERVHDMAGQAGGKVQDIAGQAGGKVQDIAGQTGDAVQGIAGQATEKVQDIAGQAGDTAQQVAGQAGEKAHQFGMQAQQLSVGMQDRVTHARSSLEGLLEDSPLAVGAIALAAGAAVGLAFPATEQENQLMGEARDTLLQKAQATAHQTLDKVQQVAGSVKETAQVEAQQQGLT